jgi:hypothetical protein
MNERVKKASLDSVTDLDESRYTAFLCECSELECDDRVELTLQEYEEVRLEATHFLLRPGHEDDRLESVVWSTERFVVVEKHVAERLLEATDPRSVAS